MEINTPDIMEEVEEVGVEHFWKRRQCGNRMQEQGDTESLEGAGPNILKIINIQ